MTRNDATHDGDEMATERPEITQQYAFSVGEDDDGSIEPAEESVETSLEAFGADVDHRERDSRIAQPEASSFGVDDRKTVTRGDGGEQRALFADTDDDQRTLTGERAASQCLFENDDSEPATDADTDAGSQTNERTASTDASAEGQRAIADGGRVEDDETVPEDDAGENEGKSEENHETEDVIVAIPRMELAGVADALDTERETIERKAGEGPKTEQLAGYVEECRTGLSILDDTDDNGTISRVAAAGAADELQAAAKTNTSDYAEELQRLASVLRRALDDQPPSDETDQSDPESGGETMTDGGEDTTFDANKETVTDDWEGVYISASWGHGQTNVELAQIVDVSDSGKTVLAQLVAGERVDYGRTSEQLRPTAEQLGDEFHLHVREVRDEPRFKGSYPLSNDGDMDGPTRQGFFRPWSNDAGESIRQTATGYGH